jgi:hypothetical protein
VPPIATRRPGARRHLWLTLAAFALAIRALIPAGYMAATDGPAMMVVLCTGQGAAIVEAASLPMPGEPPSPDHDAPCLFAGHGAGAAPPDLAVAALSAPVSYVRRAATPQAAAPAPGRGLAAPPFPARGPPSLLI